MLSCLYVNSIAKLDQMIHPSVSPSIILLYVVAFPFTEPLVRLVVDHLEAGKAMDFLAKFASKIIAERRVDSSHSAAVSIWLQAVGYIEQILTNQYCVGTYISIY